MDDGRRGTPRRARMDRDARPEMAGRSGKYTRPTWPFGSGASGRTVVVVRLGGASPGPRHHDAELAGTVTRRGRGECREELWSPGTELLGDDRRIGLGRDGESLNPDHTARANRSRHAFGHQPLEGGHRSGQAQLVLEA